MPPNPLFPTEDHAVQSYAPRYPDRMNATLNSGYPSYDTWGAPFATSQVGALGNISATTRMNMNKLGSRPGRIGLPTVSNPLQIILDSLC